MSNQQTYHEVLLIHLSPVKLVSWCFESSQPQRITSELTSEVKILQDMILLQRRWQKYPSYAVFLWFFLLLLSFQEHFMLGRSKCGVLCRFTSKEDHCKFLIVGKRLCIRNCVLT